MTVAGVNPEERMLIDGELVAAASKATFANINPATEETIGRVADAGADDMERAITAARRAFDTTDWRTNRELRKECLQQLQRGLEDVREEMREQLILEVGCPRLTTYAQVELPLEDGIAYLVKLIDDFPWEQVVSDSTGFDGTRNVRRIWSEPVGVVGAIVPWNYPFLVSLGKIAEAMATGNTVVLKPAPDTPWNATLLGRVVAEKTDIPPGVLNIVTSSDHLVGEQLTLSPQVDLVSFTGSTATGRRIMEKGSATLKRIILELGGKSATIVLDDADLDTALPSGLAVCYHAGQACAIGTRMLLPRRLYDEGVERLAAILGAIRCGDPQQPDVMLGPVISAKQRERILGYIQQGQAEGARLVLGGGRPDDRPTGFYVEPTLFADVDNSMTIAREEIFGPVLCVLPYDSDDEAVAIANDSPYGLAGYVYGSTERAVDVARRIQAGQISVNGAAAHGAEMPFGGYKSSGVGRHNGIEGFRNHLQTKAVAWTA